MAAYEKAGETDEWYTPAYIFDRLSCRFDMDVAAGPPELCRVPAEAFIFEASLETEWRGFVWMNPPFGHQSTKRRWLEKFFNHGNGIALTPDRTSAPWWQEAANRASAILFVAGKIKFIKPDGTTGDSPGTGTTLFAAGSRGIAALARAQENGLGHLMIGARG